VKKLWQYVKPFP